MNGKELMPLEQMMLQDIGLDEARDFLEAEDEPTAAPALPSEKNVAFVEQCARSVQYWEAQAAKLEAFWKPYHDAYWDNLSFMQKRIERAKKGIELALPAGTDLVTEHATVTWRTSEKGEIFDPEAIPFEYCKRVEPQPSLELLKEAWKQGKETPGYRLLTRFNLQVKPGGARAKANAKARARNKEIAK